MEVKNRIRLERRIEKAVIKSALEAGYAIGIDNHGDQLEYFGVDKAKLHKAIQLTDDEWLRMYRLFPVHPSASTTKYKWECVGWVYFVFGNDGWDVICDYTTNLEDILVEAHKISERYQ